MTESGQILSCSCQCKLASSYPHKLKWSETRPSQGIMTFTIHYRFKHADTLHTHAQEPVKTQLCGWVGRIVSQELIWVVLLVAAVWMHCFDLCGCVQASWTLHKVNLHINLFVDWTSVSATCFVYTVSVSLSLAACLAFYTPVCTTLSLSLSILGVTNLDSNTL